jgi:hypothetical protein
MIPVIAIAVILIATAFGFYLILRSMQAGERRMHRRPSPPRPEWASFFSLGEWEAFIREVQRYFDDRGVAYHIDGGMVNMEDGSQQYGLGNLAQMCRQLKRHDWAAFIQSHFSTMEQSEQETHDLELKIGDFMQVKGMLMVRVMADDSIPTDFPLVSRVDLPGTISFIVFDLPSTVRSVRGNEAEVWGRDAEELFAIALDNVRRNAQPDVSHQELKDGQEAIIFSGESFYIASHALLLEEHPECLGPHGALVAIPHRHCLITYPIQSIDVVQVVDVMGMVAMGMEREGPGSISPKLYWYHNGRFVDLPFEITRDAFTFTPPDEFTALLNQLAAP